MYKPFDFKDFETNKYIFEQKRMLELGTIDTIKLFQNIDGSGYNPLLPYVGSQYDTHKILVVAESKYITLEDDEWETGLSFYNWMLDYLLQKQERPIPEELLSFIKQHPQQIYTIEPFSEYYKYTINERESIYDGWPFPPIIDEMNEVFGCSDQEALQQIAFLNFFLIPVICSNKDNGFKKPKFYSWVSRRCCALKEKRELWNQYTQKCSDVLDNVIDILNPSLILLISKEAWYAYRGKYEHRIISLYHASDNRWWKRPIDSLDGKTSAEVCREKLITLREEQPNKH